MPSPTKLRPSQTRTHIRAQRPRRVPPAGRDLTELLPGVNPPLEQQARIFEENRRWIEAGCRLRADLPDLEGVQRLLFRYYGVLVCQWPQAAAGDETALHEMRIALRRVCTVLRAFRKRLKPTCARELRRHLRQLNRALGPIRDLDVWLQFMREAEEAPANASRYLAGLHRRRQNLTRVVRRILGKKEFRTLQSHFDSLLRVALPELKQSTPSLSLAPVAGRILARQWRRARKLGKYRDSVDDGKLHRLRIALRRLRYLAEAFAPILGEPGEQLRKRAHAVERLIALIRDTSRDLTRCKAEDPPAPPHLRRLLRNRRQDARDALEPAWSQFDDRAFRRAVQAGLQAAD